MLGTARRSETTGRTQSVQTKISSPGKSSTTRQRYGDAPASDRSPALIQRKAHTAPPNDAAEQERLVREALMGGQEVSAEPNVPVLPMPPDETLDGAQAPGAEGQTGDGAGTDGDAAATNGNGADANANGGEAGAPAANAASGEDVAAEAMAFEDKAAEAIIGGSLPDAGTERAAAEIVTPTGGPATPSMDSGGSTTIGGGQHAEPVAGGLTERTAHATVTPGGTPTTGSGSNDCLPSTASAVLAWDVVPSGIYWKVSVTSLTLAGQVNVKPWPSNPTGDTVTPNTPNPVDGGNINDKAGNNNWKVAKRDLETYNKPGGGAGPHWHSTAASSAHEWAHWNTDYKQDSVSSAAGGNWPSVNAQLDSLWVFKLLHSTKADAKAALKPKVDSLMSTWRSNTISRWNAIPDTAGVAGSTGYIEGAKKLQPIIDSIEAYRKKKGWT